MVDAKQVGVIGDQDVRVRQPHGRGVRISRLYTQAGRDPFDDVQWESRTARITNPDGTVVFEMKDVEVPASWSQTAVDIAASKYFRKRGLPGVGKETSVRAMVSRVADAIVGAGKRLGGYFAGEEDAQALRDELCYMLVHQIGAFNSPVWFNCGLAESYGIKGEPSGTWCWNPATDSFEQAPDAYTRPAVSACFILSVEDDLMDIAEHVQREMRVFRFGGGAGMNASKLRAEGEPLSGGGTSSGVMSFLEVFDKSAGAIKSGGVTRRAAKLVALDADHPDIEKFVEWKAREEDKVRALVAAGWSSDFNGEAYRTVSGQNANNSVSVPDEFMKAVVADGDWNLKWRRDGKVARAVKAKQLFRKIAEAAWKCADPGLQFSTTMNKWHTIPSAGRIVATNPCAEYLSINDSACNLASLNLLKFMDWRDGEWRFDVDSYAHACRAFIIAMDILVDHASYPTAKIAKNAHDYRQLGLGYANLGAAIMAQGVAYDSPAARSFAASVSAIMSGAAYATSADLADSKGPFPGHAANAGYMGKVMRMHQDAAFSIGAEGPLGDVLASSAKQWWTEAVARGVDHGYRNSQTVVIAPTGCLDPSTLIVTDRGLVRLGSLGDMDGMKWQPLEARVATNEGPRRADKFYVNGAVESVVSVETSSGYRIRGTPQHRLKVVTSSGAWEWRRLGDLEEGDVVPLQMDNMVGDPRIVQLPPLEQPYHVNRGSGQKSPPSMTADLAEFVGFFMGNGSMHEKGVRLSVCDDDPDVLEHLRTLGGKLFGIEAAIEPSEGCTTLYFNSVRLRRWMAAAGLDKTPPADGAAGKGWDARVPGAVLATNDRKVYAAFLRGLFEADGTITVGVPDVGNKSRAFISDVKSMLLAMGYPTTLKTDLSGIGKANVYRLRLVNRTYCERWLKDVGFIGVRKRSGVMVETSMTGKNDRIPVSEETLDRLVPPGSERRMAIMSAYSGRGSLPRETLVALNEEARDADVSSLLDFYFDEVVSAELGSIEPTFDISVPDNVTYVANGFVSHNTIGLLMDCDTTGLEPDFALVKGKKLAGGGFMKITNGSVDRALETLGYPGTARAAAVDHVLEHGTIEGAPGIDPAHYPAFDCAVSPRKGGRAIEPMGHVRMVAAIQPFLSGSASKTVNMPESTTVEEIEQIYLESWKLGLKCVSVYRDNCKASQPLAAAGKKDEKKEEAKGPEPRPQAAPRTERRRLPKKRYGFTQEARIAGHKVYVRTGEYEDGALGEIFVDTAKDGAAFRSLMNSFAIAVSIGLQHGVPLDEFVNVFTFTKFEPSGPVSDHPNIKNATSIVDFIFRLLALEYLGRTDLVQVPPEEQQRDVGDVAEKIPHAPTEKAKAAMKVVEAVKEAVKDAPPAAITAAYQSAYRAIVNGKNGNGNGNGKHGPKQSGSEFCSNCGGMTVRTGTCTTCLTCGTAGGCG